VAMKLALKREFSWVGVRVPRMRKLIGTANSLVEDLQAEEFVIYVPKELPILTRGRTRIAPRERSQNPFPDPILFARARVPPVPIHIL